MDLPSITVVARLNPDGSVAVGLHAQGGAAPSEMAELLGHLIKSMRHDIGDFEETVRLHAGDAEAKNFRARVREIGDSDEPPDMTKRVDRSRYPTEPA